MPCWTITTYTLNLQNADLTILKDVLEKRGYRVNQINRILTWNGGSYNQETGEITSQYNVDWLRPAYTKEMVTRKVKRYGWIIKEDKKDINKFTIIKR